MNLKEVVDELVEIVKKDYVLIFVCSLIALALSTFTIGLFYGVAFCGMGYVFLKLKNNEAVDFKDVFTYINKFLPLFLQGLIIGLAVGLGLILLVIPGLLVATLFIYAPFYLAYENKGVIESIKLSYKTVIKNNFLTHILIFSTLLALNFFGMALKMIGLLLTYPIFVGFLVLLYERIKIKE